MSPPSKNAYVTLLTRPSYLAGALLLAHTLHQHSPTTPLIITYTPSTIPAPVLSALQSEAPHSNILLHPVEHLRLPDDDDGKNTPHGMVAERFLDTWTKLRVFDLWNMEQAWESLCWLDADMMILSDPSPLVFNAQNAAYLQAGDGLRLIATHVCVCNLDHDAWAPKDWTRENCAFSHVEGGWAGVARVQASPRTMALFNSGMFVYRPSKELGDFVQTQFAEMGSRKLKAMMFPDQDFLNEAFAGKWASVSWRVNALKTWRYWHENMWRDDKVAVLHYIVDKPWAARVDGHGKAGYLGKDGVTHGWWWAEFDKWCARREEMGESELVGTVKRYVAGGEGVEMKAIGGGAQDFAKKWAASTGKDVDGPDNPIGNTSDIQRHDDAKSHPLIDATDGAFSKPRLGERGHGPVVRR